MTRHKRAATRYAMYVIDRLFYTGGGRVGRTFSIGRFNPFPKTYNFLFVPPATACRGLRVQRARTRTNDNNDDCVIFATITFISTVPRHRCAFDSPAYEYRRCTRHHHHQQHILLLSPFRHNIISDARVFSVHQPRGVREARRACVCVCWLSRRCPSAVANCYAKIICHACKSLRTVMTGAYYR